jgi:predicted permease
MICVGAVYGLSVLYVLKTVKEKDIQGVMIQGLYRSNVVIIGLPIASALAPGADLSSAAIVITTVVLIYNVLAIITLSIFNGRKTSPAEIVKKIAKNPLFDACMLGLVFAAFDLHLPNVVERTVTMIGSAATPLMLVILGAFFSFGSLSKYKKALATACMGRLIVIPGIFLTITWLAGFRGVDFATCISLFATPCSVSAFTMTQQIGGDYELAGDIVIMTNAVCSFTIFLWSFIFRLLGCF